MEARGKVNCYEAKDFGADPKELYIINLSAGTTPFIHFFDGREYVSMCYRLRKPVLMQVTYAHYRPAKEEFDALLSKEYGDQFQDHVLNGGLLHCKLEDARPLPDDPVREHWEYEQTQAFFLKTYCQRRPPLTPERTDK